MQQDTQFTVHEMRSRRSVTHHTRTSNTQLHHNSNTNTTVVLTDGGGVAHVVLGEVLLDLTHQVRAHIGGLCDEMSCARVWKEEQ
jgi:hypothetical protein